MRPFLNLTLAAGVLALTACASGPRDLASRIVVSVPQQRLALFRDGQLVTQYPISTSKFGIGDEPGSYATPGGRMRVAQKIGHGQPLGTVFKSRRPTGEILPPNAPGRDPIVTRILWLEGLEPSTRNAFRRMIYIHGTTEERNIGKPVSFGCIRMRSADVLDLFNRVGIGAEVFVTEKKVSSFVRSSARTATDSTASTADASPHSREVSVEPDRAVGGVVSDGQSPVAEDKAPVPESAAAESPVGSSPAGSGLIRRVALFSRGTEPSAAEEGRSGQSRPFGPSR